MCHFKCMPNYSRVALQYAAQIRDSSEALLKLGEAPLPGIFEQWWQRVNTIKSEWGGRDFVTHMDEFNTLSHFPIKMNWKWFSSEIKCYQQPKKYVNKVNNNDENKNNTQEEIQVVLIFVLAHLPKCPCLSYLKNGCIGKRKFATSLDPWCPNKDYIHASQPLRQKESNAAVEQSNKTKPLETLEGQQQHWIVSPKGPYTIPGCPDSSS